MILQLVHDAKRYLSVAAALLLSSSALHVIFGRHLYFVVGERRGAIAFLQIFSIIMLPFSVFLIVGGQYIVDTGTLASAPYTGIIIFAVGVAMLLITMLAFVGGNFEYRRLLSICCLFSFVFGVGIVGVSIAYFAMRKGIHENLIEHWEIIRDVLPPTYQARYDREQFGEFMQTNLKMVAFVGIISGLFLMGEAGVCLTLMHQSTLFKRQLAQDKEVMKLAQGDSASPKVDPGQSHVHRRRQVLCAASIALVQFSRGSSSKRVCRSLSLSLTPSLFVSVDGALRNLETPPADRDARRGARVRHGHCLHLLRALRQRRVRVQVQQYQQVDAVVQSGAGGERRRSLVQHHRGDEPLLARNASVYSVIEWLIWANAA